MGASGPQGRRGGVWGEFALALPPTLTVLVALALVEALRHERVIFASLAASAFLIYRDPLHPMNGVRVLVPAHLIGLGAGSVAALALGAAAMVATIAALVALDLVHPPAIATALGFAFYEQQHRFAGLFLVALTLLVGLVVVQVTALWAVRRASRRAARQEGEG